METPAPLPETSPVVTVPPVFVTGDWLVAFWSMVPIVEPTTPALPSEATETEAAAPVAPTDADAPLPERSPMVKPARYC